MLYALDMVVGLLLVFLMECLLGIYFEIIQNQENTIASTLWLHKLIGCFSSGFFKKHLKESYNRGINHTRKAYNNTIYMYLKNYFIKAFKSVFSN